jgi:hypothetical protein
MSHAEPVMQLGPHALQHRPEDVGRQLNRFRSAGY